MTTRKRDDAGQPRRDAAEPEDCWLALGEMALTGDVAEPVAGERIAQLAHTIEHEIIPRLMLAHRVAAPATVEQDERDVAIDAAAVQAFARSVIGTDDAVPWSHVEGLRARGVSIERLYLELLAGAARCLGQWWTEDRCDFTEVTIGLGRLQRIMRELSPSFGGRTEQSPDPLRVLLLPGPGEQHTFGLVMVAEFFRRDGWDVSGGSWEAGAEAARLVASEWFDVLGLSLAAEVHAAALGQCIGEARASSRNRDLVVIVGGPIFQSRPDIVEWLGADLMATDGHLAPALAAQAVARCRRYQ